MTHCGIVIEEVVGIKAPVDQDAARGGLPSEIYTGRLRIRPYRDGDGCEYLALCSNNREHLLPYERGNPALSIHAADQAEQLVREFADDWEAGRSFFLGAWRKDAPGIMAQIVLTYVNRELPELAAGYFVDRDQEGKGYVTEALRAVLRLAFDFLGAKRVRICCNSTNLRSIRVAERCGFTLEGCLRQAGTIAATDQGPSDELIFGLLKDEYRRGEAVICQAPAP